MAVLQGKDRRAAKRRYRSGVAQDVVPNCCAQTGMAAREGRADSSRCTTCFCGDAFGWACWVRVGVLVVVF